MKRRDLRKESRTTAKKMRYIAPILETPSMTKVSRPDSPVPTYRVKRADGSILYLRKNVSQEMLDLQHSVRKRVGGRAIEEPLFRTQLSKENIVLYRDAGKRLEDEINDIDCSNKSEEEKAIAKERIALKLMNLMARVHTQALVEHWHPHLRNVTVYRKQKKGKKEVGKTKLKLIDYKYARKKQVQWTNAESVLKAFEGDYFQLDDVLESMDLRERLTRKEFFKALIKQYPMAMEERAKLLELIFRKVILREL